ncbi:hypothetical protein [Streptomyces sp. NPDC096132]|uniref:hypothetical protein n=1 Tax=Streptomyces sp. NPDC096132 TaxID=3366075 RepID=UPI00381BE01E
MAEVHLEPCAVARPDPRRPAEWLVREVLGDQYQVTDLDPLAYADGLGPAGLARMRQPADLAPSGTTHLRVAEERDATA